MQKRKRLLLALGLLVGLGLLALSLASRLTAPPPSRINQQAFDAIAVGLTEQEVEALLSRPAGA
jgi:hypothetical protein